MSTRNLENSCLEVNFEKFYLQIQKYFINMSDSFDSFSNLDTKGADKELQEFLMVEKQKAQFNAQVN